jgi:glycosyltransferase involved in cell wall biosynthesis
VIAVSEQIRELSTLAGVPSDRIHVIPDGIDIPTELPTAADRAKLRASWGLAGDDFVVGLLGASTPEKGHDVAVAAVHTLKTRLPHLRLLHATNENTSGILPTIPPDADIIRVTRLSHLDEFLPGIDLLLMPSRAEGLGSSVLWAMSYGIPVVAARVGGLPEIVTAGQTGWLVSADSPEELAEAIFRASQDGELIAEYGRNGRKRSEEFSKETMVNRTERLYHQLTAFIPK